MTLIRRTSPFDELFTLRRAMDRLFDDDFILTLRIPKPERELVGAGPAR
jgi:hypothetical protein